MSSYRRPFPFAHSLFPGFHTLPWPLENKFWFQVVPLGTGPQVGSQGGSISPALRIDLKTGQAQPPSTHSPPLLWWLGDGGDVLNLQTLSLLSGEAGRPGCPVQNVSLPPLPQHPHVRPSPLEEGTVSTLDNRPIVSKRWMGQAAYLA